MKSRDEFPNKIKVAAWERCGGFCEECTAKLYPGKFTYDHNLPDWFDGPPTLENCVVRCSACDKNKTYQHDIPRIAKTKRQRNKQAGIRKRQSRPMAGTKASGIRIRMNGQVEKWT